jgi:hypothetical protein
MMLAEREQVNQLIARLGKSDRSPFVNEAAWGVIEAGCQLRPPSQGNENYVRILAPNGEGIGLLAPGQFVFSRETYRERLLRLPGAVLRPSGKVTFSHRDGADNGLAAVREILRNFLPRAHRD